MSTTKRKYSSLKLQDAMALIQQTIIQPWNLDCPPLTPTSILLAQLDRLQFFDLLGSEQAKTLLIDALLTETLPRHKNLKAWKAASLETDSLTGFADYLIAPFRAYLDTPLLCTVEAKRDDFDKGAAQCIAEMYACQWNNARDNITADVHGIVSNGQGWVFYRLAPSGEVFASGLYAITNLPNLLGFLDGVLAACAKNVPV